MGNTVTRSPELQQTGCLMPTVGAAPKQPAPALCPVPPKPGRGPAGGAQAVVAGKSPSPGLSFLIWRMKAVTLAQK